MMLSGPTQERLILNTIGSGTVKGVTLNLIKESREESVPRRFSREIICPRYLHKEFVVNFPIVNTTLHYTYRKFFCFVFCFCLFIQQKHN